MADEIEDSAEFSSGNRLVRAQSTIRIPGHDPSFDEVLDMWLSTIGDFPVITEPSKVHTTVILLEPVQSGGNDRRIRAGQVIIGRKIITRGIVIRS